MISYDTPREARVRALIEKHYGQYLTLNDREVMETLEDAIREAVALGESLKEEELSCDKCHRKLDLPWFCETCTNYLISSNR